MYKVQLQLILVLAFFVSSCSTETPNQPQSEPTTNKVYEDESSGGCALCKPKEANEYDDQDIEKASKH